MAEAGNTAASDESIKLAAAISLLRSKFNKNCNAISPSQSDTLLRWKRKVRLAEEDETEQLKASVDFLVELCETVSSVDDSKFANLAHQSVDFILGILLSSPIEVLFLVSSFSFLSSKIWHIMMYTLYLTHVHLQTQWSGFLVVRDRRRETILVAHPVLLPIQPLTLAISLKNLLSTGRNLELVERIINSLVTRLTMKMCSYLSENGSQHSGTSAQFCIQHMVRKLGSEPYIGQRAILSVCQRILVLAERLLFSDPFDDTFPDMHECMFIMIQLIEFLVADYLLEWSKAEDFDTMLLEDWMMSIIQARKALELLESRNGLYSLYMDRVTGELAKHVGGISLLQKIKPDIFNRLFQ
ncbi:hypothetical protein TSUD_201890 [Trifolium subterraneum]|uniref:Uncharacterized protein n=1 Tax=Trifolium subterraneum TaxID=3900 RepID=A0A2Z6LPS6_TRISU|nr:hypothetical protein TSUD_201890 [Trifolium subterraneum]